MPYYTPLLIALPLWVIPCVNMASAFGHALSAIAIGSSFSKGMTNWKFWIIGMICAILPDADVVSFALNIPYEDFWGHRGFTHSLLFALIIGVVVTGLFYRKNNSPLRLVGYCIFFTLCTASHSVLDAMTSGGLGVAFFSPWDDARYFFPWRPIKVSPIGVSEFFSEWGKKVILSELIWIGIPCTIYMTVSWLMKSLMGTPHNNGHNSLL